MKRKQITVNQYYLNNISEIDDKLIITEQGRKIEHFHNFFIQSIENILDGKIPNNTYFILKFDEIKEDDTEMMELYDRALREGVWLNGVKYVKSVKSPSMVRTQKTLFIRDNISKKVMEYVSLGKIPTHAVVSKLEAAYGISLSSVLMVPSMPRIVFVKDMKKVIKEDVEVIRECAIDEEQMNLMNDQVKKDKELRDAWKENKPSEEELKKLTFFDWSNYETHKSKNSWYKNGYRLKLHEITNPAGYGERNGFIYPVYTQDQTEEIDFPRCNSQTLGKEIKYLENHEVPMTMFDGQALGSFQWFKRVSKDLGLSYTTNGVQGRLPYFKGLVVRFDIQKWCKDNQITEIEDLFGNKHKVTDIDIIATESCWKAFHDYSNGKKQCLFSSIEEWYQLMDKYGINNFGIANYAKDESFMKEFTPLNYQFIYALPKLSFEDLKELSKPYEKLLYKVKEGKDVAYIKAFLQMMDNPNEKEYFSDKCLDMISIDERLIFDKKIQKFLRNRVSDELKNLAKGRIPIRGGYRYLTQDVVALMEWAVYQDEAKVKGFLSTPYTAYKRDTEGIHLLMRNPTTSPKETVKATFIESDNTYIKHLNSIIVTSINDLLLPKFTADVDGDTCMYTKEPSLLKAIHDNVPLIHEADKQFSQSDKIEYTEYSLEEIINYEKRNTSSMIGILTNWNTKFQDLALADGRYLMADIIISVNKIYQMMLIDAAKTGEVVDIAYPIQMWGKKLKKPYFMYHIYGGNRDDFSSDTRSPFNKYVRWIESKTAEMDAMFIKDIDPEYYQSISNPMELFQYREKLPSYDYINLVIEKLKPIYAEYTKERNKVNSEIREFNLQPKVKQDPAIGEQIRNKFSQIKHNYRLRCHKIEPNLSILATAAVELGYRLKGNYDFSWDIAYEGMRWNALQNRLTHKTVLHELVLINYGDNIAGVSVVKDGKMTIKQVEINRKNVMFLDYPIEIDTDLADGKYSVLSMMGRHYAILEEENNHPKFMCHYWYDKKDECKIEPILNKSVRFLTRGKKAIDVINSVVGKKLSLITVPEKGYANVFNGNDMICSIAPDYISKGQISMGMNGWIVMFHSALTPTKENQKSFTATISICED